MKLRLCVIGCGGFARIFAESLAAERDRVDLYFASRDLGRAKAYSDEFGGLGSFASYEDAAANPDIDAVYVCTPHDLHLEHTLLATAANKHILLEKPIARTIKEARAIISAASDAGVKLMVAENYRFLSPVLEAKRLIESGIVGRVRLVQLQEEFPFDPSSWRNDRERTGGGVLIDGGIHKASVLAYLSGRPDRVYAVQVPSVNPGVKAEDGIIVTTCSPEGVVGIINHTWSIRRTSERPWVSVTGTLANLHFEMGRPWLNIGYGDSQETRTFNDDHRGIIAMVLEFRRSILEGTEPSMTGEEGMKDLALVLKAYESVQSGSPAEL
ncbi:MAG: Gfo/Idh/MocA family oxidoreductase [Dehalococcoidia bacterium]|nr:Gfo/Idh/MocA family oxidoreductase [Dehalococcoidia bacterium]